MQCHSLVNVDIMVTLMKAWKKEGRIKYLGVTHYETPYFEALADWVEKGDLDFVQVHYSIHTRHAEERILPAAADHGTAVSINMPLEKARLHAIVQGRPLPDFAKELEIETWSAFFLKWVISNPLVTVALPATTNPDHLVENMGALRGPLPDKKMRANGPSYGNHSRLRQDRGNGLVPGQNIPGRYQSRSAGPSQTSMRSSGSRRHPD
jgi:diketogulonate reductase-like aldo/keto reductase